MKVVPDKEDNRSYVCKTFKAYSQLEFKPRIRVMDGIVEIERNIKGIDFNYMLSHISLSL
jgi:hypothetical protein